MSQTSAPWLFLLVEFLAAEGGEVGRDVVVEAAADVGGELLAGKDEAVPLLLGEAAQNVLTGDVVPDEPEKETGIEVVAGTDGAHGLDGRDRILLAETGGTQLDRIGSVGVDEVLGVEGYL